MNLLRLFAILLFICSALPVHADAGPPQGSIRMGTTYCQNAEFDCDRISSESSKITQAANDCVTNDLFIKNISMNYFSTSGEFENCILPSGPVSTESGSTIWASCCIKKNDEVCNLYCTKFVKVKS